MVQAATAPRRSLSAQRPSTASSIFPGLLRLDLQGPDMSHQRPASMSSKATVPSVSTALLTLKLSGPSFLDTVVKDNFTKEPLYIVETLSELTSIYRLDQQSGEAFKAAYVQWPVHVPKSKSKSGRSVRIGDGRWREAEEFLKLGTLGNSANRKFILPNYPHPLRWKLVPGNCYICTTNGVKGPIAALDAAVLSAPPRLRVYQTLIDSEVATSQANYRGVPSILLDFLVTTSLLLLSDVQDFLDRPATQLGRVHIPGSSQPSVQRWLSVIRGHIVPSEPPTSPPLSPSATAWDVQSEAGSGSGSGATSIGEYPLTPATSAPSTPFSPMASAVCSLSSTSTSTPSVNRISSSSATNIPPVPPLPELPPPQNSTPPPNPRPYAIRRLPQPPTQTSPSTLQPWFQHTSSRSDPTIGQSEGSRPLPPPSPRMASFRGSMRSLPPQTVPPPQPLPRTPSQPHLISQKLTKEYARSTQTGIQSPGTSSSSAGPSLSLSQAPMMVAANPDLPQADAQLREITAHMQMLAVQQSAPDAGSYASTVTDSRFSYAESVYEMPPPAYDAIDFSQPSQRH